MNHKNKIIATSALALAITVSGGAILNGQAFAATKSATGTSSATAQSASVQSTSKETFKGRGGHHGQRFKLDDAAIATLLGMTKADLETAERAGKSLATIAGEKGVAVQSVIDLVAKQLTASLDSKLAAGSITQAQYDTEKANVATKAKSYVDQVFSGKGGRGGKGGARIDDAAVATLLGMTEADLKTAEHAGKSLATIAGEKGVAVQSVVDLVAKQLTANLDSRLAAGSITQTQYDAEKANVATKAAELVNATFQGGKGGHGGRGGARIDEAAIAALLGMTEADYETAEHAGKSMAALATEKGVAVQSVVDLVAKQLTAALDTRLANGKITQAQYDTQKANVAAKATEIVNATHTGKGGHGSKAADDGAQTGTANG